ncbi:MAG: alpha-glucan family phosphorylase [Mycobacteriales bacterium]
MRALRRLTVRAALPESLAPLGELVSNLRWCWHPETLELFESIDPDLWREVGHDPVKLLGAVDPERLSTLSEDRRFLRRLTDASEDLHDYLTSDRWYQTLTEAPAAIAYFSPEFGITEVLPQYSGGLGILAGDHLKAASDLGVPLLGVGLLYRAGYFSQSLSADGWQQERYPPIDPYGLPLTRLTGGDGKPCRIAVGLPDDRLLWAQIWVAQVGRVPLLMLDSDVEENDAAGRAVTDRLYGGGTDHRLLQEILLGIGGVRAVRAYTTLTDRPAPEVFHTNEGHAGFLGLERIREYVEGEGLSFDEAMLAARAGTVFTTHTPVPAGIDRFPRDQVARHLPRALGDLPLERLLQLGAEQDPTIFNMAHMGLRLAQRANGVSLLHGEVSRNMFAGLWPGFEANEVPIGSVTNGVHAATWVAPEMLAAAREADPEHMDNGHVFATLGRLPASRIWEIRRTLRGRLVDEARRRLRATLRQRGYAETELGWVNTAFDPDILTLGFARRVPSYKRLTLMLRDPDRLKALLLHPDRPIQLVIAGKAHPADEGGKALIQQMVRFCDDPEVRHRIVFLPDYDIGLAKYLVFGSDVWVNNPLRPLEACGTSGMKVALNGGLNLSIRDGWWDELFDPEYGWAIPSADGLPDQDRRDDVEAAAFYDLIENHVAPRFYDRDPDGVPERWMRMVSQTLRGLGPQILASRMLRDYTHHYYAPAAESLGRMVGSGFSGAKELAAWREQVIEAWPAVHVVHVDSAGAGDSPALGASLTLRAEVYLNDLNPADLDVQAAYGTVDQSDQLHDVVTVSMKYVGDGDGRGRYEANIPLDRAGAFGYTVRVLPHHDLLAGPAELGLVAMA